MLHLLLVIITGIFGFANTATAGYTDSDLSRLVYKMRDEMRQTEAFKGQQYPRQEVVEREIRKYIISIETISMRQIREIVVRRLGVTNEPHTYWPMVAHLIAIWVRTNADRIPLTEFMALLGDVYRASDRASGARALAFKAYLLSHSARFSIAELSTLLTEISDREVSRYFERMMKDYMIVNIDQYPHAEVQEFVRTQPENPWEIRLWDQLLVISKHRGKCGRMHQSLVRSTSEVFQQ